MSSEMKKMFDHKEAEQRIYQMWEDENVFHAEPDPEKEPFCIVIPPPNVTGILHMGHVLDNTAQDAMTRWHRMRGFCATWIPGTDHAGIATQNVVKKKLEAEGIDYRDLGREKFLEKIWEWKDKHGNIIINQLKRLGCSCDWERERFTMDEGLSHAVKTAFVHLFEKDLIYRGKRMVNWCCKCSTALANEEVDHEDEKSHLWNLRYPVMENGEPSKENFVIVATTRPETMLGDTAVAVNPNDSRYADIVGKTLWLPLKNREIPVIADDFVDQEFGTGCVKVTPAHDPNDYQMGLGHNLEVDEVIGLDGLMTESAGEGFVGLSRKEARKKVVEELEKLELLEGIEDYKHAVGKCYRCKDTIEPTVSDQWYVKMRPLAKPVKKAVNENRIEVVPASEKQDLHHWLDTVEDWCISRQLWWGHQIPVYYCRACDHHTAAMEQPSNCEKCGSSDIYQDPDVLDTWFSSQLWPYSTLGWPEKTEELKYWYPNNWLMSGRDILFFWDLKMMVSGLELVGDVPFRTLALHGMVRDKHNRKLSKSLGNSPDPLELFDELGADAVRAGISSIYPMGRQDTKLGDDVFQRGQSLLIKIWNAFKLLLSNLEEGGLEFNSTEIGKGCIEDRWIISRFNEAVKTHDKYLDKTDFVHAYQTLHRFFWDEFCDWYLEIIKSRMREEETKKEALSVAFHIGRGLLKLFHPYIPFITEELWQTLRDSKVTDNGIQDQKVLALSSWPEKGYPADPEAEEFMSVMTAVTRAVREVRAHLIIPHKEVLSCSVSFSSEESKAGFSEVKELTETMAYLGDVSAQSDGSIPEGAVPARFPGGVAYVTLPENVDAADLKDKLAKKIEKLEKALKGVESRLKNKSFVDNAPDELVQETEAKAAEFRDGVSKMQDFMKSLK